MRAHDSLLLERKAGGAVIAYCEMLCGVDDAEILNIETHPNQRRQGLAEGLLREAVEWARVHERRHIWLEVRVSNTGAMALYAKLGFEIVSTRQHYYADGEDAIVMKYTL